MDWEECKKEQVLSKHLPGETEANQKISQKEWLGSPSGVKPETF
jgi:hypothetical protein